MVSVGVNEIFSTYLPPSNFQNGEEAPFGDFKTK